MEVSEYSESKVRAARMLGKRSFSADEIKKRLMKKGDPEEVAQSTVDWLEETGLVDDAQYAQAIVRHYCAKGYGPARVKDELFRRGVPREMWEDALEALDGAGMESAVDGFLVKKLNGSQDPADLRRAASALVRRGFSYDQAKSAVDRHVGDYE